MKGKRERRRNEGDRKRDPEGGKSSNGSWFLNGIPDDSVQLYQDHDEIVTQEYVADVIGYDPITKMAKLLVRNYFQPHSVLEIFGPKIISTPVKIEEVFDEEETLLEVCNKPMEIVYTKWDGPIEIGAMVRKIKE